MDTSACLQAKIALFTSRVLSGQPAACHQACRLGLAASFAKAVVGLTGRAMWRQTPKNVTLL
jgi:hypothetical protein